MTGGTGTRMEAEIGEAPDVVARQAAGLARPLAALAERLRARLPRVVVTCARGSSAHAATLAKHLIETRLGIPVAAAAPSVATVYGRDLALDGQFFLAISQSGRSDDLVESARSARRAGALTVALVNEEASPLVEASDVVLPMAAGPEFSVAATKTVVASAAALMRLAAAWTGARDLVEALERLPERLAAAGAQPWPEALEALAEAESLVTIGRGPTLWVAREAALKLKEACNLHAEAFSGAEFLHGPVTLVGDAYPILLFTPTDAALAGARLLAEDLAGKGARVLPADAGPAGAGPSIAAEQPEADGLCELQRFYRLALALAQRRGLDVDHPRHLRKVTRTR